MLEVDELKQKLRELQDKCDKLEDTNTWLRTQNKQMQALGVENLELHRKLGVEIGSEL